MTTTASSDHAADSPISKALALLQMLEPENRATVLDRMDPALRARVEQAMMDPEAAESARPHGSFSDSIAQRRALMREAAQRMHERRLSDAEQAAADSMQAATAGTTAQTGDGSVGMADTGDQSPTAGARVASVNPAAALHGMHPAAVARALQGERPEVWAMVLDMLEGPTRQALESYLDPAARQAIDQARISMASLPGAMRDAVLRAIQVTVVPAALREQQWLMHGLATTLPAGGA